MSETDIECIKCNRGTLEQNGDGGFYTCNACGRAVAPGRVRDRHGRKLG